MSTSSQDTAAPIDWKYPNEHAPIREFLRVLSGLLIGPTEVPLMVLSSRLMQNGQSIRTTVSVMLLVGLLLGLYLRSNPTPIDKPGPDLGAAVRPPPPPKGIPGLQREDGLDVYMREISH